MTAATITFGQSLPRTRPINDILSIYFRQFPHQEAMFSSRDVKTIQVAIDEIGEELVADHMKAAISKVPDDPLASFRCFKGGCQRQIYMTQPGNNEQRNHQQHVQLP